MIPYKNASTYIFLDYNNLMTQLLLKLELAELLQGSLSIFLFFSHFFLSFCPNLSKEVMAPYLPTILTGVTALLPTATEDTLHLVIDTLLFASKVLEFHVNHYFNFIFE